MSRSAGVQQVEVLRPHRGDIGQQVGGPGGVGQRPLDLGVDDRPAVAGVHLRQPRAVENAGHRLHPETGVGEQFGQLSRR